MTQAKIIQLGELATNIIRNVSMQLIKPYFKCSHQRPIVERRWKHTGEVVSKEIEKTHALDAAKTWWNRANELVIGEVQDL